MSPKSHHAFSTKNLNFSEFKFPNLLPDKDFENRRNSAHQKAETPWNTTSLGQCNSERFALFGLKHTAQSTRVYQRRPTSLNARQTNHFSQSLRFPHRFFSRSALSFARSALKLALSSASSFKRITKAPLHGVSASLAKPRVTSLAQLLSKTFCRFSFEIICFMTTFS